MLRVIHGAANCRFHTARGGGAVGNPAWLGVLSITVRILTLPRAPLGDTLVRLEPTELHDLGSECDKEK
jgi:hypothetical protein